MNKIELTKEQIIIIHGGVDRSNYTSYLDFLLNYDYNPYKNIKKTNRWNRNLGKLLGDEYEVFKPEMPNKDYADYNEWKIMFEKLFPFLKEDYILIGHSLGGSFLVKYLNENVLPIKFKYLFLIAGAFEDNEELLGSFNFDKKLKQLKKHEEDITFYHSKDDFCVPFSDLEKFKNIFKNSKYRIFENKGHFLEDDFNELISDIKNTKPLA